MITINKLINLFQLHNNKNEKQDKFKDILLKEYRDSDDFYFLQIGANDGIKFDDLFSFVISRRCRGVVVEPLKIYYKQLKANYTPYPNIIPLNIAIHKNKKKAQLHYVDPRKIGSLPDWSVGIGSLDSEHHKKSNTPSDAILTEEVDCMHLMELIKQQREYNINLLQIDVEGYDGEVLRMIDFDVIKPKIIKYEHGCLDTGEQMQLHELLRSEHYDYFTQGNDTIAIYSAGT